MKTSAAPVRPRLQALAVVVLSALAVVPLAGAPARAQTGLEGVWERTGSLSVPRYDHTLTLLRNGRVLAAGGRTQDVSPPVNFNTAEIYDPVTEQWTPTGSMNDYRWQHTATLLPDGRVLVAGGFGGSPVGLTTNAQPVLDTAEIYDPATGRWTRTGSLNVRRALHVAELLPDGRVLVAGGRTCDQPPPATCNFTFVTNTAEIYDPATGRWTLTGSMSGPRHTTGSVVLPDGRVLVPAGFQGTVASTNGGDVYNPATGTWSPIAPLNVARSRQGAMLLPDGRVFVALGFQGGTTTEIYDPATNRWTLAAPLTGFPSRFNFAYAVLPNGQVLIASGQTFPPSALTRRSDVYNPATNQWAPGGEMNDFHATGSTLSNSYEAVVLSASPTAYVADPYVCGRNCGKVLVAGYSPTGTSELYTAPGTCYGFNATLVGTTGNDDLAGTSGRDVILGLGGNDRIAALAGDDVVCAGAGDDQVAAGDGNDVVLGGDGLDRLAGGVGNDALFGERGNDDLSGGRDVDLAEGYVGTDRCVAETLRTCE
ncbi:MAG TPA: kelch repeat-containing protein [Acidimicrobiales bacterium]|nr:kelch repeat-containing protein [Acidimicrobiales bacterium]